MSLNVFHMIDNRHFVTIKQMRMKEGTIIGLIAGTAIGIAIGSFLSSEDGKQFRRDVKDKVSEHLKNLENDFCAGDAEEDVCEETCNTAEEV